MQLKNLVVLDTYAYHPHFLLAAVLIIHGHEVVFCIVIIFIKGASTLIIKVLNKLSGQLKGDKYCHKSSVGRLVGRFLSKLDIYISDHSAKYCSLILCPLISFLLKAFFAIWHLILLFYCKQTVLNY